MPLKGHPEIRVNKATEELRHIGTEIAISVIAKHSEGMRGNLIRKEELQALSDTPVSSHLIPSICPIHSEAEQLDLSALLTSTIF